MKFNDFAAHCKAKLRVEIRKRFVHHKNRCVLDDRSAERNALHLSARKLFGQLIKIRNEIENTRRIVNFRFDFIWRESAAFDSDFPVVVEQFKFFVSVSIRL